MPTIEQADAPQLVTKLVGNLALFHQEYWQRRPHLHRSNDPSYLHQLLSLRTADMLLAAPSVRPPYVDVTCNTQALPDRAWTRLAGSPVDIDDAVDADAVAREFARGASVYLNSLADLDGTVRVCCKALQSVFHAPVQAVGVITPAHCQGLGVHLDAFEGLVVQTHGSKLWRVYERQESLPTASRGLRDTELGELTLEVVLHGGECLYIPWGSPHYAVSEDDVSCHVTFMITPRSWAAVIADLLVEHIPASAAREVPNYGNGAASPVHAKAYIDQIADRVANADIMGFLARQQASLGVYGWPASVAVRSALGTAHAMSGDATETGHE